MVSGKGRKSSLNRLLNHLRFNMKINPFFIFFFVLIIFSCKKEHYNLNKIEGKLIPITDTLDSNPEIEAYVKPFREHVENDLDNVLSYSYKTYSKTDGEFNTAIGNFMADAVYEQANPIFKSRTGKDIDLVILNHGGIRSIISKGNITTRTAYEIMPFENSIVVVALKGKNIHGLVNYLVEAKSAHPVSKLKLKIDKDFNVIEALVNNEEIDTSKTYFVATNDYLYSGGGNMTFFKPNDSLYDLNYKIRNALIDYFKKTDTIKPVIDDRFIQIK